MLDSIQIVLSHTSHPGNIGSTARAMKTMGLSRLTLVNPKTFPDEEAYRLSSGATDVLDKAKVVNDFDTAIASSGLVIGTSARKRSLSQQLLTPRQLADLIRNDYQGQEVSIVFGRENFGMSNEELERCDYHVVIPANPEYSSLNLGAAVQLISYELRVGSLEQLEQVTVTPNKKSQYELATKEEVEGLVQHWEQASLMTEFLDPENPGKLMSRMRRLFNRSRLEKTEVNILRGFLKSVIKQKS